MKRPEINNRAVTLTLEAKIDIRRAVGARIDQPEVYQRALQACLKVLSEGGTETDARVAASMNFFESVRETCGEQEEGGDSFSTNVMLPTEGDVMNFFTILAEQLKIPRVQGCLLIALIQAAGGRLTTHLTAPELWEIASAYFEQMGVHNFQVTTPAREAGNGGH